jgi:hypothetical protein
LEHTDSVDVQPSEGGAHFAITRAGKVEARLYAEMTAGDWYAVEFASCSGSGIRLPGA